MSRHNDDAIDKIIVDTIATLLPDGAKGEGSISLLGSAAVVDSVGFFNLLVTLSKIWGGDVDLPTSFMERGDSEENNPFLSIDCPFRQTHEFEAASR